MELLMKIFAVFLWNILIPFIIGLIPTRFMKKENGGIIMSLVLGIVITMGIFEPVALVFIFKKKSFMLLVKVMKLIWCMLALLSLVLNAKRIIMHLRDIKNNKAYKNIKIDLTMLIAIIAIGFQIYMCIAYQHVDDDDAFYVATATTAVQTDSMYKISPYTGFKYKRLPTRYILSPMPIYYAMLSQLTNTQATEYAHSYLPVIVLIFVYGIYYLWSKLLFDNHSQRGLFLLLICAINIFGGHSIYTTQSFLVLRMWQGKAILASGLIPLTLYFCYCTSKEGANVIKLLMLFMLSLAASMVSSMGIFLTPVAVGVWALTDLVLNRRIKNMFYYIMAIAPCIICGLIYIMIKG